MLMERAFLMRWNKLTDVSDASTIAESARTAVEKLPLEYVDTRVDVEQISFEGRLVAADVEAAWEVLNEAAARLSMKFGFEDVQAVIAGEKARHIHVHVVETVHRILLAMSFDTEPGRETVERIALSVSKTLRYPGLKQHSVGTSNRTVIVEIFLKGLGLRAAAEITAHVAPSRFSEYDVQKLAALERMKLAAFEIWKEVRPHDTMTVRVDGEEFYLLHREAGPDLLVEDAMGHLRKI